MQIDKRVFVDLTEPDELGQFFSLVATGVVLALKEKVLSVAEAERILFSPYTVSFLKKSGCPGGVIDLVERGCELEDIESLIPEDMPKVLDKIINGFIEEIGRGKEILPSGRRLFVEEE